MTSHEECTDLMASGWEVGVDVGGTFTDVVAFRPAQAELRTAKVPSRPDHPIEGLLSALSAVGVAWEEVLNLVHATTLVTNAIVEDRLADAALITTQGFADTLSIGRQNRRFLYRLDLPPKVPPPVPQELCFEIRERLDARGQVLVELEEESVEAVASQVEASGARAVAVCLLHAYANPAHEDRLGKRLRETIPYVALSHRISPEAREYERTVTTVLSSRIMPLAASYLNELEERQPEGTGLHLFHSAGGMASPQALRDLPLGFAMSGPAAGVAAAGKVAAALGIEQAISLDMGGTTTDACLIIGSQAEVRSDRRVGEVPLRQPMVAVETIGAGGGSIARMDMGVLRVGPASAGADPGPACYARGGTAPTVCDANLLLGYLNPQRPLGNEVWLEREAAQSAVAPLARELAGDVTGAALGIVRVANATVVRALRRVTVERGIDGRQCTLVVLGGAGPMHAVGVARMFGIEHIVVPALSSTLSAVGCITASLSYSQQQTVRMGVAAWDQERLSAIRGALLARLTDPIRAAGHGEDEIVVEDVAAVRYSGQSYAVEIAQPCLDDPDRLGRQFRARHQALYGFETDEPWELQSLRVKASVAGSVHISGAGGRAARAGSPVAATPCCFVPGKWVETPRYERAGLVEGQCIRGPAVVEDQWSTVVVPPGSTLTPDGLGHLHMLAGEGE